MAEETKKDKTDEEKERKELSQKDLENVSGGRLGKVNVREETEDNKHRTIRKFVKI